MRSRPSNAHTLRHLVKINTLNLAGGGVLHGRDKLGEPPSPEQAIAHLKFDDQRASLRIPSQAASF